MANISQISDGEWEVMKVIWDKGPLTAGEVVKTVSLSNRWHARTIKTLLMRLVKKGAVRAFVEGKRHLYKARVDREACRRQESRSFIMRVFDGAIAPALVHIIKQARLSQQQVDEL